MNVLKWSAATSAQLNFTPHADAMVRHRALAAIDDTDRQAGFGTDLDAQATTHAAILYHRPVKVAELEIDGR